MSWESNARRSLLANPAAQACKEANVVNVAQPKNAIILTLIVLAVAAAITEPDAANKDEATGTPATAPKAAPAQARAAAVVVPADADWYGTPSHDNEPAATVAGAAPVQPTADDAGYGIAPAPAAESPRTSPPVNASASLGIYVPPPPPPQNFQP